MKTFSLDSWKITSKTWHSQVIYYPPEKLKYVAKVVLQHHNQGNEAIGDYVINVLPTTTTTTNDTTTTTTLETIKTILETADGASSLERILSKIVAEICPKHSRVCENLNLGEKGNLGGEMIEETDSLEKLSLEDAKMLFFQNSLVKIFWFFTW